MAFVWQKQTSQYAKQGPLPKGKQVDQKMHRKQILNANKYFFSLYIFLYKFLVNYLWWLGIAMANGLKTRQYNNCWVNVNIMMDRQTSKWVFASHLCNKVIKSIVY